MVARRDWDIPLWAAVTERGAYRFHTELHTEFHTEIQTKIQTEIHTEIQTEIHTEGTAA